MREILRAATVTACFTGSMLAGPALAETPVSTAVVPGTVTCSNWNDPAYEGPVLQQPTSGSTADLSWTVSGRSVSFEVNPDSAFRVEVVGIKGGSDTALYFFDQAQSGSNLSSPRNQNISTLSICGTDSPNIPTQAIPQCPFPDDRNLATSQCPAELDGYLVFAFNVNNPDETLPVSVCQCSGGQYHACSLDPSSDNFCQDTSLNGPLTAIVGACTGEGCSTFCYQSPTGKWQCIKS
jgi:hypothetical protein